MGSCSAIQINGVTRQRFTCLQQNANQQLNVQINGDNGSASDAAGANTIAWNFDEATGLLTVQATKTPYPCFLVKQHLEAFLGACP
jgi:hypothetical protein